MKKQVIEEMNNFAIRVLKGGSEIHPQETAILPEVLEILKSLPDAEEEEKEHQQTNKPTLNDIRRENGLDPIPDGDVTLTGYHNTIL